MRAFLIALALTATAARAQEVIETQNGPYRAHQDSAGRYLRLESAEAIVNYLYDSPSATAESGIAIDIANGPTLTVRYDAETYEAPGMPKLTILDNADGRTSEVRADGAAIAVFAYRADKNVESVSIPGHFTMRLTAPDRRHRVRQTLVDANGAVIRQTEVTSSSDVSGIWRGMSFDTVTPALGFDARSLSYHASPDGYLQTGRDAAGRVALYLVSAGSVTVGFTPDGVARFYDITADVIDSEIPPGSDVGTSVAQEQSKAVPAHVTLTAGGILGVYIEEPADGAIHAAWADGDGRAAAIHHALSSRDASSAPRDSSARPPAR